MAAEHGSILGYTNTAAAEPATTAASCCTSQELFLHAKVAGRSLRILWSRGVFHVLTFYVDNRVTGFQTKRHLLTVSCTPYLQAKSNVDVRRWMEVAWVEGAQGTSRQKAHVPSVILCDTVYVAS